MTVPHAFIAYCRADDEHDNWILEASKRIRREIRASTGEQSFDILIDIELIGWGQQWRKVLDGGISSSLFLIPIVTPSFLRSTECRREVLRMAELEQERGRDDLILPVLFRPTPGVSVEMRRGATEEEIRVAKILSDHQYVDWTDIRDEDPTAAPVKKAITALVGQLQDAFERPIPPSVSHPHAVDATLPTLIVDSEAGHHGTLQEALARCGPGYRILIRPGRHPVGKVRLDRPVDIIGQGDRNACVLEFAGSDELLVTASSATVRGVTLSAKAARVPVLQLSGPKVLIENTTIEGNEHAPCIAIQADAGGVFRACTISHGQYGVSARGATSASFLECHITENSACGIVAWVGSKLHVSKCTISKNGHGLWLHSGSEGTFADNDLSGNRRGSINKDSECRAVLLRNKE